MSQIWNLIRTTPFSAHELKELSDKGFTIKQIEKIAHVATSLGIPLNMILEIYEGLKEIIENK